MFKRKAAEKGVVLLIVLGTVLVISVLTTALLAIIYNQSRLTHHQVSRIKAYYAAIGIMNYAQEQLRKGVWVPNPDGITYKYACFTAKGCIDAVTNDYPIADDADIPYKVQVKIFPLGTVDVGWFTGSGITQIEIKTDYTYTP